jgi:predicted phage gp36 major capsid-like protein
MPSTTTTGSVLAILGDFRQFLVVDRLGVFVERVDTVVDGNGVPVGARGWMAWKRTSSLVTNVDGFRFLLT